MRDTEYCDRDCPAEIQAMTFLRCPECGTDGMEDRSIPGQYWIHPKSNKKVPKLKFFCHACKTHNTSACPNDEQMARAIKILRPTQARKPPESRGPSIAMREESPVAMREFSRDAYVDRYAPDVND